MGHMEVGKYCDTLTLWYKMTERFDILYKLGYFIRNIGDNLMETHKHITEPYLEKAKDIVDGD